MPRLETLELQDQLELAVEKLKSGNSFSLQNLDDLQKALSEQRIEIYRYGYENEDDGILMDEDHFDQEFDDLEICYVDEPTCYELDIKSYSGKRNNKGLPDMRTRMGKDWA